jgi:hypothetical protein
MTRMAQDIHSAAPAPSPGFSLFRLSALTRCAGATILIALLWAAVYWALH